MIPTKRFRVCYQCERRNETCHSTCKEYAEEVRLNQEMLDQKKAGSVGYGYVYDSMTRMYRRKRGHR